jgi:outer membrane protein
MKGTRVHNDTATDGTSYTTATSSLSSSVNIFNGFSDQAAVESAGFSLSAERHNLNRVQQSTVYQTISTFIAAITNQELITVGEENLQDNRRQLARILAFYKAGKRPVTDLYQQQAETSQAELSLLSDERDLQTSKLEVLQTIGISSTERFRIVAPDIPEPSALKADLPAQDILATALATRTDLQSQEHRIKAAGEDINKAHAGLLPKISLSAEIDSNYNSKKADGFGSQLKDNGGIVALSITLPLFDKWKTRYEETQARINLNKEQIAQEKLSRLIGVEVEKALQAFRIAAKQFEVAQSQTRYAQQALAASEERCNVGAANIVELSAARKRAIQARYDQIKALYDLLLQRVAIAFYLGDTAGMLAVFATR